MKYWEKDRKRIGIGVCYGFWWKDGTLSVTYADIGIGAHASIGATYT